DVEPDALEGLLDAARAGDVRAYDDRRRAEVERRRDLDGLELRELVDQRVQALRILPEGLGWWGRNEVPVLVDDPIVLGLGVDAGLESLEKVDDRGRRRHAGKHLQEFLEIPDPPEDLQAPDHARRAPLDDDVEEVAAHDVAVDGLVRAPYLGAGR